MDNYPDGNMAPSDPRSPLYEEPPACDECGEDLAIESDCDEDGVFTVTYCDNYDCKEYGELA